LKAQHAGEEDGTKDDGPFWSAALLRRFPAKIRNRKRVVF